MQPDKPRPIFIGGIHGVGKSTTCSKVSDELNIPHLTASDLIRQYKKEASIQDADQEKRVVDIPANQDILITALHNSVIAADTYILDGHFTLIDSLGAVKPVPISVFEEMNPKALFIITEKPELIQSRLLLRDEKDYCSKELRTMQDAEIEQAQKIAKGIDVPLYQISFASVTKMSETIGKFIKNLMNHKPNTI
ncbi:MAG: ATP-binding protein [Mariprofundaceae bacterium]|nr:ATP-binding protein [Mariprofundaceae bacterium]